MVFVKGFMVEDGAYRGLENINELAMLQKGGTAKYYRGITFPVDID